MVIRPRVLLLVLHIHLPLAIRRPALSTLARRLNTCRDRTTGNELSQSMLTMIVIKCMVGKVLRIRRVHGPKLLDRTQAILLLCPNMIRMATVVPFTRCLIPRSKVQCIRQLLYIGPTLLRRNTLKHPIHRITITLHQTKTMYKPLPRQLQHTQPLYVRLHHVTMSNTPSEKRC